MMLGQARLYGASYPPNKLKSCISKKINGAWDAPYENCLVRRPSRPAMLVGHCLAIP